MMGDVHPIWKNAGVPAADWPEAREHRLYIDKGLCRVQLRGCTQNAFHVHHRRPSDRRMKDHNVDRLVSVCLSCHGIVHNFPGWSVAHGWLLRSGCEGGYVIGCELSCEVDHRG